MSLTDGKNCLGIGVQSERGYYFGSGMNLSVQGAKLCNQCASNTTGTKRFRPSFYNADLEVCSKCQTLDPTDPCVYKNKDWIPASGCNYGFARNLNNWASPSDGNKFAQYRWG